MEQTSRLPDALSIKPEAVVNSFRRRELRRFTLHKGDRISSQLAFHRNFLDRLGQSLSRGQELRQTSWSVCTEESQGHTGSLLGGAYETQLTSTPNARALTGSAGQAALLIGIHDRSAQLRQHRLRRPGPSEEQHDRRVIDSVFRNAGPTAPVGPEVGRPVGDYHPLRLLRTLETRSNICSN